MITTQCNHSHFTKGRSRERKRMRYHSVNTGLMSRICYICFHFAVHFPSICLFVCLFVYVSVSASLRTFFFSWLRPLLTFADNRFFVVRTLDRKEVSNSPKRIEAEQKKKKRRETKRERERVRGKNIDSQTLSIRVLVCGRTHTYITPCPLYWIERWNMWSPLNSTIREK